MFRHRHRRYRMHRFGRFDDVAGFAGPFGARRAWRRGGFGFRRRRTPMAVKVLLAGLAVFAFVKLTDAINRSNRSTFEKMALGALVAIVGAYLVSLRNSSRQYRF
jgi:hypothetical protein